MRKELWALLLSFPVFLISCGNKSNHTKETLERDQTNPAPDPRQQAIDLVGEWEQTYTVFDKNADDLLNNEERSRPSPNKIGDYYLRFNNDGTCTYSDMEFEVTYEVKMEKGTRTLFVYGTDPRRLRIMSLSKSEMVLMPSGAPGTFLVYRKYANP
jgi:hypothetical protein